MSTVTGEQDLSAIKPIPILIALLIAGFIGLFSETALKQVSGSIGTALAITIMSAAQSKFLPKSRKASYFECEDG